MKFGVIFITAFTLGFSFLTSIYKPWALFTDLGKMPVSEQVINDNCNFDGITPEVIATGGTDTTEWHGRFDLPDMPYIWEPAKPCERILNFREALRERFGADINSQELTERQHAIFVKLPDEWSGEAANSALLLDGHAGTITDMSCLEMMLWKWQDAPYPTLEHPTEFSASVLRGHGKVRVYLSSADFVGVKVSQKVTKRMQADIMAGYRLITHIHNHPFLFNREVGDRMWTTKANIEDIAGALAPSMSDVGFYRSFRDSHSLEEAWITNGLQSSRFHASEFDTLNAQ